MYLLHPLWRDRDERKKNKIFVSVTEELTGNGHYLKWNIGVNME